MSAHGSAERRPTGRVRARVGALLVTAAITVFIGWAARAPYHPPHSQDALLRLSWRLRLPAAEVCRQRTREELDALPVHMRAPEVCESHVDTYTLRVRIDSLAADSALVLPGGVRADRPVYVLRELPLAPGPHRVRVRFERNGASSTTIMDTIPRVLALDTVLHMRSGVVALITLDDGRLVVRSSAP